jgi:hypothetical protein
MSFHRLPLLLPLLAICLPMFAEEAASWGGDPIAPIVALLPMRLDGNAKAWWAWQRKETKEVFTLARRAVPVEERIHGAVEAAADSPIGNVRFENVTMAATEGVIADHVLRIRSMDTAITPPRGPVDAFPM